MAPRAEDGVRKLSSDWTGFYKYAFPALWIATFGAGTVAMFVVFSRVPAPPLDPRLLFLAILLGVGSLLIWYARNLKTVALDGTDLVISDAEGSVRVPLKEVVRVTGSLYVHPELIWLTIRRPGKPEQKVMFMPPIRFWGGFTRHPLVKELDELIGKGRGPVAG